MDHSWSMDLYTLCMRLGWCNESIGNITGETDAYIKAITYYKEAFAIKPDNLKFGSAIARIVQMMLDTSKHRAKFRLSVAEEFWDSLTEHNKEQLSIKWLKAFIEYKKGNEQSAIEIALSVAKNKNWQSEDVDWIYFSQYLLAKIYWKQKREVFTIKYIRSALKGFGEEKRTIIADNRSLVKKMCKDALKWYEKKGLTSEAEEVRKILKVLNRVA